MKWLSNQKQEFKILNQCRKARHCLRTLDKKTYYPYIQLQTLSAAFSFFSVSFKLLQQLGIFVKPKRRPAESLTQ